MKLAFTVQGENLNADIDPRFGRCQKILVLDSETEAFEVFDNTNVNLSGGAGIQTAKFIIEKDVHTVLTGNVGPNAYMTLTAADIQVFTGISGTVSDAIEKFRKGELQANSEPSVESHHGMSEPAERSDQKSGRLIAVAADTDNGLDAAVSAHFGRCPFYILAQVTGNDVQFTKAAANPYYGDHGQPGQVPGFINELGAQVIIAGGMGPRAVEFFNQFGIEVVTGAQGTAGAAVQEFLQGTLKGAAGCNHDSCDH